MDLFTAYDKEDRFFFNMSNYCGNSFDNKEALNIRFSLVYIESGSGVAKLDRKILPYIAPCAFCLNEKEHIDIPASKDNKIRVIYLHPCVINSAFDFYSVRTLPEGAPMTLSQDKELLRLFVLRENDYIGKFSLGPLSANKFSSLYDSFYELTIEQKYPNWPCRSRSYLMWLLFLLENLYSVGEYSNDKILGNVEDTFSQILVYIYHNYDKKLTVADITSEFYISRTTISKLFQENVGETFLTYLNKVRITMAATMLRDTLLPINKIMFRVGFTDNAHFLRTFKKYNNYSPTEYRDKFGWL